jgi:hypothetical protein
MADTTVLGLFEEISEAAQALNRLRNDGGRDSQDVMVISGVPFPEGVLESDRSPIRLPLWTLIFALVGIGLGLLLALGSQELYTLRTGGKPVASGPPTAIIAYEVMMLVALTGAFIVALFEMRLPSWRAKVYDPRISEGLIGIAAYCTTPEQAEEAESFFRDAGAADVRRDARAFV